MEMRNVYLAGPFFNPVEVSFIEQLELILEEPRVDSRPLTYFSPRKDGGNADRQGDVKANVAAIFEANLHAMRACGECIAVLDRLMSPGQGIFVCENVMHGQSYEDGGLPPKHWKIVRGPIAQPDLGTVWELGYLKAWNDVLCEVDTDIELPTVWASKKILAGFTMRPREPGGKMNVMLSQGLDVIIHGFDELRNWLRPRTAWHALEIFQTAGLTAFKGDAE